MWIILICKQSEALAASRGLELNTRTLPLLTHRLNIVVRRFVDVWLSGPLINKYYCTAARNIRSSVCKYIIIF